MGQFRIIGLFGLIPATVLLTISFFVLVVLRKVQEKGLKLFGYIVTGLLWFAALLMISLGIYTLSTGKYPFMRSMMEMKKMHMQQMMNQGGQPMMGAQGSAMKQGCMDKTAQQGK